VADGLTCPQEGSVRVSQRIGRVVAEDGPVQLAISDDDCLSPRDGAMKAHCIAIGAPHDAYEGSIDDYC